MQIPFLPLRLEKALKLSRGLLFFGEILAKAKPSLKANLYQAGIALMPREYAALALFSSVFYLALFSSLVFFVGLVFGSASLLFPVAIGAGFSAFVFAYLLNYPYFVSSRRMKLLEKDMLASLQHILIEVKSGVPLFNAMVGISEGYGKVSDEFRRIVKEINAGTKETEALDEASRRNPSANFRRALWQIVNALRSGSDIAGTLESIVDNLAKEQIIAVRKYGQELNPYTMMYMLIAIILPSLGVTFLIIFSSFSGVALPKSIFPIILIAMALFQFFYMGMIKSKRPVMEA